MLGPVGINQHWLNVRRHKGPQCSLKTQALPQSMLFESSFPPQQLTVHGFASLVEEADTLW